MYYSRKYLSQVRLLAYIEQLFYVNEGDNILEIGGGPGIFRDISSKMGKCTLLDINKNLNPDIVMDMTDWKEAQELQGQFDKIFCCQVLEHMDFAKSVHMLQNILSLKAKLCCISIPDNRPAIKCRIELPKLKKIKKVFSIYGGKKVTIETHREHYWEMNSFNKKEILKAFYDCERFGYSVAHYRFYERPSQHFFIYKLKSNN